MRDWPPTTEPMRSGPMLPGKSRVMAMIKSPSGYAEQSPYIVIANRQSEIKIRIAPVRS